MTTASANAVASAKRSKDKPRKSGPSATKSALRTLALELEGLQALQSALKNGLSEPFDAAVELIRAAKGRVIISGIGKSGHVGQKLAATLASTGTPAFFVHPSEASHGDLGMITSDDVIVALSWSGETVELKNLIEFSRRFRVGLIAITSGTTSALAKAADVALVLPKCKEACPHGLAPTTSTTMMLALGDGLAIALLESKGFTALDFKMFHPGGSLGASLKYASDLMHGGDLLPLAGPDERMQDAILTMTTRSFGCLGVVNDKGKFIGMVTDGDLRRHMGDDLMGKRVGDIMTKDPKTIAPDMLASAVIEFLSSARITAVFVLEKGRPVGIVHLHDLIRIGSV
jgi:arabinose-5-phosphate isomerase